MALTLTPIQKNDSKISPRKTSEKQKLTKPLSDNSLAAPATLYDLLSDQIKGVHTRSDSLEKSLHTRIDSVGAKIDSVEKSLHTRIDSVEKSLHTRIDSVGAKIDNVEKNLNTRIDDAKMVVDKTDKRISNTFVVIGICATIASIFSAGIFTILGIILSKIG